MLWFNFILCLNLIIWVSPKRSNRVRLFWFKVAIVLNTNINKISEKKVLNKKSKNV